MNKFVLTFCAALAILGSSCSSKDSSKAEDTSVSPKSESTIVAPIDSTGTVIELANKALIAPDMAVERLTILDFNATWCGPCQQLAPVLSDLAKKYQGQVTFISIDVDRFPALFESFKVGPYIPAVVICRPDGKQVKYTGTRELLPFESFDSIIQNNLK